MPTDSQKINRQTGAAPAVSYTHLKGSAAFQLEIRGGEGAVPDDADDETGPVCETGRTPIYYESAGNRPEQASVNGIHSRRVRTGCLLYTSFTAHLETRNEEIPKLMQGRKKARRARRTNGRRCRRQRRAKANGTISKKCVKQTTAQNGSASKRAKELSLIHILFLLKRNLLAWIILLMTFTLTATAKLPIIRDSIVRVKRKLQKSSANCLV